jgi:hypothetical protein
MERAKRSKRKATFDVNLLGPVLGIIEELEEIVEAAVCGSEPDGSGHEGERASEGHGTKGVRRRR